MHQGGKKPHRVGNRLTRSLSVDIRLTRSLTVLEIPSIQGKGSHCAGNRLTRSLTVGNRLTRSRTVFGCVESLTVLAIALQGASVLTIAYYRICCRLSIMYQYTHGHPEDPGSPRKRPRCQAHGRKIDGTIDGTSTEQRDIDGTSTEHRRNFE